MLSFLNDGRLDLFYDYDHVPFAQIARAINEKGFKKVKGRGAYCNEYATFDIETTTIEFDGRKEAFMYVWQACIAGFCIYGRWWDEFVQLLNKLENYLPNAKFVWFVHYLPFEFQFMRDYIDIKKVFALSNREVVYLTTGEKYEFRCSYKLTNMGLDKFTKQMKVAHRKQSGEDFDYEKIRTNQSKLTQSEMYYCFCDVMGLYEAIAKNNDINGDTIASMPLTSTGYIRREARRATATPEYREIFLDTLIDEDEYILLRTARRGGNSHCNPIYSGELLTNIISFDMKSAYPGVMLSCKYPMGQFFQVKESEIKRGDVLKLDPNFAYIMEVEFTGLNVLNYNTIPYIPSAKAVAFKDVKPDNGRVLSAELFRICITDIDYSIIEQTYEWEEITVIRAERAVYDYLPDEYRDYISYLFQQKCVLEDNGDPYVYAKFKNRINATFGMMLTDMVHKDWKYFPQTDKPFIGVEPEIKHGIERFYDSHNSFLAYQWGVWVTAHCRNRLQKAIMKMDEVIYCDTDSVKVADTGYNRYIVQLLNEEIRKEFTEAGYDNTYKVGVKDVHLGEWDQDGDYSEFLSLGSKKYCYTDREDGKFHITVAGLNKDQGRAYIEAHGKFDAFREDTVIPAEFSGRTASAFNDRVVYEKITVNGDPVELRSNVAVYPVPYTFSLTDEYARLLEELRETKIYEKRHEGKDHKINREIVQ